MSNRDQENEVKILLSLLREKTSVIRVGPGENVWISYCVEGLRKAEIITFGKMEAGS